MNSFYCSNEELALRHTAIAWLGSLLRDQFPTLQPLGGAVTPSGILYRMIHGKVELNEQMLPVLNERLKIRYLDAMRENKGAVISREMLASNAIGLFKHRKEALLATVLQIQEEEKEEDDADSPLLSLVHIGAHIEPVPLPHAPSLAELGFLTIVALDSVEIDLDGKLKQVWVFNARIFSSTQEIKKWDKQKRLHTSQATARAPQALWVDSDKLETRIWTPFGVTKRLKLLEKWRQACKQLEAEEIYTQGEPAQESLPWSDTHLQACSMWALKASACGIKRAAECLHVLDAIEQEVLSPQLLAILPREMFEEQLRVFMPLLLEPVKEHLNAIKLVLLVPEHMDAKTHGTIEALRALLQEQVADLPLAIEARGKAKGLISLCVLLCDQDGAAFAGPSLTINLQHPPVFPNIIFIWNAYGTLESFISWQEGAARSS